MADAKSTLAAVPNVVHSVDGIYWSYDATPTTGNLLVESPPGTTIFQSYVTAGGAKSKLFPNGLKGAEGQQVLTTLASDAAAGKLNVIDVNGSRATTIDIATTQSFHDGIDDLLTIEDPVDKLIFTTYAPTSEGTSVYNGALWGGTGADLDFTGIQWYKGTDGTPRCTAITPRHLLTAKHTSNTVDVGTDLTFIAADGSLHVRQVKRRGEAPVAGSGDVRVIYLDADLPASIKKYPIFHPDTIATLDFNRMPVITIHPWVKSPPEDSLYYADVRDGWLFDYWSAVDSAYLVSFQPPIDATRLLYWRYPMLGSSCPSFAVTGTDLVLLGTHWKGNNGWDASPTKYYDALVADMADVEAGETNHLITTI